MVAEQIDNLEKKLKGLEEKTGAKLEEVDMKMIAMNLKLEEIDDKM